MRYLLLPLLAYFTSTMVPVSNSEPIIPTVPEVSQQVAVLEPETMYDQHFGSTDRSAFLQLGEVSSPMGSVEVFAESEPIDVEEFRVILTGAVSSIDAFFVYDSTGKELGVATRDGGLPDNFYTLVLDPESVVIPKREDTEFYVRARVRDFFNGGVSGQLTQISRIEVHATGVWSSRTYIERSRGTFNTFQTSRGVLTDVQNEGPDWSPLTEGSNQQIGSFRFAAITTDSVAEIALKNLTFSISTTGGVSVSNPTLRIPSSSLTHDCSVVSQQILCSVIPFDIGELNPQQIVRIEADVDVPTNVDFASLQLVLSQPGSPMAGGGAIEWSDGSSTFNWVQLDPLIATGTKFEL